MFPTMVHSRLNPSPYPTTMTLPCLPSLTLPYVPSHIFFPTLTFLSLPPTINFTTLSLLGACSDQQLAWLENTLQFSYTTRERAFIFTHMPIYLGCCRPSGVMLNGRKTIALSDCPNLPFSTPNLSVNLNYHF